ncbi:superoxide dismutase family protein [Gracilimonas sp. Q87]|uniref:superoxide dismutase family protein n=1 Tax=Gracilimonas sp. Q87 TaxID=3384766 RepID=UPI003983F9C3
MKLISLFTALLLITVGCNQTVEEEVITNDFVHSELVATTMPVNDSDVSGSVTFTKTNDGVSVMGEFEGLEPGKHGFHIHEFGDCRADDGTSAGGHFNPLNKDHGAPSDMNRHMGDLGNIEANEEGIAMVDYVDDTITLEQIIGRGIIVHAGEDDLTSQPTGAAGSRVACGVIGIAQTE